MSNRQRLARRNRCSRENEGNTKTQVIVGDNLFKAFHIINMLQIRFNLPHLIQKKMILLI